MSERVSIVFGALYDSIAKQLTAQGLEADAKLVKRWDRAVQSQTFLRIHGFLIESAAHKVNQKIMREIAANVSKGQRQTPGDIAHAVNAKKIESRRRGLKREGEGTK